MTEGLDISVLKAIHDSQALGGAVSSPDDVIVFAKLLPGEASLTEVKLAPIGFDWRFEKYLTEAERKRFITEEREKPSIREFLVLSPTLDSHARSLRGNNIELHVPTEQNYLGYILATLKSSYVLVADDVATQSPAFWEALAAGAIPLARKSDSAEAEAEAVDLPVFWSDATPPFSDVTLKDLVNFAATVEAQRQMGGFTRLDKCLRPSAYSIIESALIEKRSRHWVNSEYESVSRHGLDPMGVLRTADIKPKTSLAEKLTEHPDPFLRTAWEKTEESPLKFDLGMVICVLARARKLNRVLSPEELALLLTVELHKVSDSDPKKLKFIEELKLAERLNAKNGWSNGLASKVFAKVVSTATCRRTVERRFKEDDSKSPWNSKYPQMGTIVTEHFKRTGRPLKIVEVGAGHGGLGEYIMKTFDASKVSQLVGVDPYTTEYITETDLAAVYGHQNILDLLYKWVKARTKPFADRWKLLRLTSDEAAWALSGGNKYDLVYLDANTKTEAVKADAEAWSKRLAANGALVFAGIENESVKRAAGELAEKWGVPAQITSTGSHAVLPAPPVAKKAK